MKDIRLNIHFLDHFKTVKLKRKAGSEAIENLLRLFVFTAEHKPEGLLTNMDGDDIEIAARWNGPQGQLFEALVSIGWLDLDASGFYRIHDWSDHQGYVVHSVERSEQARRAAEMRWQKHHNAESSAHRMQTEILDHANSSAPFPNPSPDPKPDPKPQNLSPSGDMSSDKSENHCPHEKIVSLYHEILPALPRVAEWTPARQALLRKRWNEKDERQSVAYWGKFFHWVSESDFLMGRTEKPFTCDLEWLVRPRNFVKVLEGRYHGNHGQPVMSASSMAVTGWAERERRRRVQASDNG